MLIQARCFAELNDYLPTEHKYTTFSISVPEHSNAKYIVDSIGIPLELVDLILVNNSSVDLEYKLKENDRISFYPVFETLNISCLSKVHIVPLRQPKFVIDVHLGKLAHLLRMLGFDTIYQNNSTDSDLLSISISETRILLSKDKALIENKALTHAHLIRNKEPRLQLLEILDKLDLYSLINPFTRCIECNSLLEKVDKEIVLLRIPQAVKNWCNEYQMCPSCNRIYWKGSHYKHMNAYIHEIIERK